MIADICLIIIAACLVLLVAGLSVFLVQLAKYMGKIHKSTIAIETKLYPFIEEAVQTIRTTTEIASTVKQHIELATPLFNSFSKVGQYASSFFSDQTVPEEESELKPRVIYVHESPTLKSRTENWVEWISLGAALFEKIKERMAK
jgi:uncharacterized protein YoxC